MDIDEETGTAETIMKLPACLWGECDIGYEGEWTVAVCGHTCTSISVFGEQGSVSGTLSGTSVMYSGYPLMADCAHVKDEDNQSFKREDCYCVLQTL
ncbi:hypothetical protein Tco_0330832 [Tanacetum coccineum]